MSRLEIWPAVDVHRGRASQVVDPVAPCSPQAAVERWVADGARRVHLVDLDRARGEGDQLLLVARVIEACPVPVQLSGGLVPGPALEAAAATGAARLTLSSAALADPGAVLAAVRQHGARLGVGLDVRPGQGQPRVTARGVGGDLGALDDLEALVRGWPPVRWVVTDVSTDGMRSGPPLELLRRVGASLPGSLVASGGVAGPSDLSALVRLRRAGVPLEGVIIGAALHQGSLTLSEAHSICEEGHA